MTERTDERKDLYWQQLERASRDTKAWPAYVKEAFPKPLAPKAVTGGAPAPKKGR